MAALPGAQRQLEAGACGAPAKAGRDEAEPHEAAVQDPSLPADPGAWEEVGGPILVNTALALFAQPRSRRPYC